MLFNFLITIFTCTRVKKTSGGRRDEGGVKGTSGGASDE